MTRQEVGTINATWTDPTGTVWYLSDLTETRGYFTRPEISGWGAAPYEFTTDPLPRGGEDVRAVRVTGARITWPLHIWGYTHEAFLDRYRDLKRAFVSTVHRRAPGTLRVMRPDGTGREIDCYYEDGFGGEPGENWLSASPAVTLYAPDSYWRDIVPTTVMRQYSPGTSFLSPFPTVSSGQVLGETVVNNPGDVDAWPTWTVTGPASSLTAENVSTGQQFILTTTLLSGETATITTRRPTVRGPAGENLVNALDWPDAYLWPLLPGDNNINFTVGGSGSGTTIVLEFYALYEGA